MIVYLLGKSPFEYRSIETYLDLAERQSHQGADVRTVFLHGAVLIARKKNEFEERVRKLAKAGAKIYFRKEDLDARGIDTESVIGIGASIDTVKIMKLAVECDTLVSVI